MWNFYLYKYYHVKAVNFALLFLFLGILSIISIDQAAADEQVRIIPFKISSQMWYAPTQKLIPTPGPIIEKIKKAFELWATVKEAGLQFRYDGLTDATYKGFYQIPRDGSIYIILNNWYMGHCNDGLGEHWGEGPDGFKGGAAVLNTSKEIQTIRFDILVHEIGHALGIVIHGASPSSMMSEVGVAWNVHEYITLSEQDRAALISKWNPQFRGLYSISGTIEGAPRDRPLTSVFTVDIKNGHAYSAETDGMHRFTIFTLKSGDYRIFAKDAEALSYQKPVGQSPSWYIDDKTSTNDPYGGTILHLDDNNRHIENINITMINEPVPFNLFNAGQTYGKADPYCFIRPGNKTKFTIEYSGISSVEAYGEHPDYSFSNLYIEPRFHEITYVTVAVDINAKIGERLLIAKGEPGQSIQAGLVGVNVVKELPPKASLGDPKDLEAQIRGKDDFKMINISDATR